jgi:hypothetical protein
MRRPNHYPKIPTEFQKVILELKQLVATTEGYVKDPACPYGAEFKDLISLWEGKASAQVLSDLKGGAEDAVLNELEVMLKSTKNLDNEVKATADKVTMLKTKAQIVDKIIAARGRALNLKDLAEFQTVILSVLDEVLTKDQRAIVISRLKALKSFEGATAAEVIE